MRIIHLAKKKSKKSKPPKKPTVDVSLTSLIKEHKELVQTLKQDDPKGIAEEALDQSKELWEYRKLLRRKMKERKSLTGRKP